MTAAPETASDPACLSPLVAGANTTRDWPTDCGSNGIFYRQTHVGPGAVFALLSSDSAIVERTVGELSASGPLTTIVGHVP